MRLYKATIQGSVQAEAFYDRALRFWTVRVYLPSGSEAVEYLHDKKQLFQEYPQFKSVIK